MRAAQGHRQHGIRHAISVPSRWRAARGEIKKRPEVMVLCPRQLKTKFARGPGPLGLDDQPFRNLHDGSSRIRPGSLDVIPGDLPAR